MNILSSSIRSIDCITNERKRLSGSFCDIRGIAISVEHAQYLKDLVISCDGADTPLWKIPMSLILALSRKTFVDDVYVVTFARELFSTDPQWSGIPIHNTYVCITSDVIVPYSLIARSIIEYGNTPQMFINQFGAGVAFGVFIRLHSPLTNIMITFNKAKNQPSLTVAYNNIAIAVACPVEYQWRYTWKHHRVLSKHFPIDVLSLIKSFLTDDYLYWVPFDSKQHWKESGADKIMSHINPTLTIATEPYAIDSIKLSTRLLNMDNGQFVTK